MNKRGFTLIELLVTIVLFSLLLVTALYSFRFISLNIRNINNTNPQKAVNFSLLRSSINSIYYYVEVDKNELDINKKIFYFFEGKKDECYYITNSPLFSKRLSIVHLVFKDSTLWYEEGEIFRKGVDYLNLKSVPRDNKFSILKDIQKFSFEYVSKQNTKNKLINKIPNLISIIFTKKSKKYQYYFVIKSNNQRDRASVLSREGER
ncbi:MAG: type II secretion system protein [Epsilonproteobacteria bacterium]|nr:type II secretion system protein [Campylobacterota bacterium]